MGDLARRSCILWAALSVAAIVVGLAAPVGSASDEGRIRFVKVAASDFDRYTYDPSLREQEWMRSHYWRMRVFASYFGSRTAWSPPAGAYKDLYAVYADSPEAEQHPDWILRDRSGSKLYIPYGCSGTRCPQYAGDIGSPSFREQWIQEARDLLEQGYGGFFIDDVNMDMRVGDGRGDDVRPMDPRTGAPMTDIDWRRYMAQFVREIREALPDAEIVHNALWWAPEDDVYVQRAIASADYVELERGFSDPGIHGGGGKYGLDTFLEHIDWLHSRGKGVILESYADTARAREYDLAGYFLQSTGRDAVAFHMDSTPDDWWSGYETRLGSSKGRRYHWRGVLRRDFGRGIALLNEPDTKARELSLGRRYEDLDGRKRRTVRLDPGEGAVLVEPR